MTFKDIWPELQTGKRVRRAAWSPCVHLSRLPGDRIIMHLWDGRTGPWVYNTAELSETDWELFNEH